MPVPGEQQPLSPPRPAARHDDLPLAERLRRLHADLAQRWQRGERVLIESYLRDPAAARDFLADRLHDVWRELVAPFWIRIRDLLDRDIQERTRQLAQHGLRRVLDELHPRIRWTSRGLSVRDGGRAVLVR